VNATRAYARASQETASKERLMVLLFEAALRHMRQAGQHFEAKADAKALPLLTRAAEIVSELAATLNPRVAPELVQNLTDVYLFVSQRLAHAAVFRDARAVREAEVAFAPIVDGFQQAVASLQSHEAP
jgi:flagellar secretion chaperone FliS